MELSKLATACQKCKHVVTCDHTHMKTIGYLPSPLTWLKANPNLERGMINPTLLETMKLNTEYTRLRELFKPVYLGKLYRGDDI